MEKDKCCPQQPVDCEDSHIIAQFVRSCKTSLKNLLFFLHRGIFRPPAKRLQVQRKQAKVPGR